MTQTVYIAALLRHKKKLLLLRPQGSNKYQIPRVVFEIGQPPKQILSAALQHQLGQPLEVVQLHEVYSYSSLSGQVIIIVYNAALKVPEKVKLSERFNHFIWESTSNLRRSTIDELSSIVLGLQEVTIAKAELPGEDKITARSVAKEVVIYTDGGSRGNPGPSAAGFVINNNQEETLVEGGEYLGITTNNQAEYQAVKLALEKALTLDARIIHIKMDSLLVVNQMLGIYQIKNRDLWPIYAHIKKLIERFDKVTFQHVRREFNQEADRLVNKVLDEHV